MPPRFLLSWIVALLAAFTVRPPSAAGGRPSESLLPNTTKGYISIPDFQRTRESWDATQLGQLMSDPALSEFADDLWKQIEARLDKAGVQLGVTRQDLEGICGGEVCLALIQPNQDKNDHASAMLIDVTGRVDEARALFAKVTENQVRQGGKESKIQVNGIEVTRIVMPKKKDRTTAVSAFYFIHQNQFVVVNHEATCRGIIARYSGEHQDTLVHLAAYRETMRRCRDPLGEIAPHIRWFVEPFGLVEVSRAARGGRRRRGTDMLKVLSNQGFRAVQGIGGHVVFATGEHEILHHAHIYAPGPYALAARMFEFPNADTLGAQTWIPRDGAVYLTFNWKMKEAFEYASTLVDEIAGDEIFEEVLKSIKQDPNGPRIDIRNDLVAHLGERATFMTDYRLPITPESERFMFAIELADPAVVKGTVDRAMEHDPEAKKREFNGHLIWEILNEEEEDELLVPRVDGVPGFGQFPAEEEMAEEDRGTLPNSAITVAHGHLIVASHVDFVRDMLRRADEDGRLAEAVDYLVINDALQKLGSEADSFRIFSRMDESYRPTYELIRQGRMPQSQTLLGKLLNNWLGPEEEGVLREQEIDGSKMPDYQIVRRYLGPSGAFIRSEPNGWFVTGCVLSKESP